MSLEELLIHLQNEELNYFDQFYNQTKDKVFYMIYSITKNTVDSEDIMQDVYLKFLRYKKKIKPDGNILSYLLQIAKSLSLNYLKKHKRIILKEDLDYPDEKVDNNLDNSLLNDLMKKVLKDLEYQVVILHIINELTFKEISKILKKPIGTLTYTYNMAIKKLRKEYHHEN